MISLVYNFLEKNKGSVLGALILLSSSLVIFGFTIKDNVNRNTRDIITVNKVLEKNCNDLVVFKEALLKTQARTDKEAAVVGIQINSIDKKIDKLARIQENSVNNLNTKLDEVMNLIMKSRMREKNN